MRHACLAIMFALVAAFCGCSRPSDLVPVRGMVRLGDRPLPTGTVSLRADASKGNETQHHPTGVIGEDGRYELYTGEQKGAPPGWYKVVVFATSQLDDKGAAHPGMPQSIIHARYNDAATSPLAVEVKADALEGAYDLTLEK